MRRNRIIKYLMVSCGIVLLSFLTGCLTIRPLPLSEETSELRLEKESLAIYTVQMANQYKVDYQPEVHTVTVVTTDKAEKAIIRFGSTTTNALDPFERAEKQYNRYLISMSLPAGKYRLAYVNGSSKALLIRGNFQAVIFSDFEIGPNKVLYLGRIEATLRERKSDDEPSAGSIMPFIDQAATGFGSGTFDVTISDKYEEDIALFKNKYSVLNQVVPEKAILGPWKRPSKNDEP